MDVKPYGGGMLQIPDFSYADISLYQFDMITKQYGSV